MRRFLPALAIVLCFAGLVQAQPPGVRPYARPAFSPYLNLNRFGSNPAINYYGLVRPQLRYNADIQQLQQNTFELQQREPVVVGSELPATGHATGFLNHQRYFLNKGGTAPGGTRR
jgi:hypothetical protein